jgi:hypothetical protein
LKTCNFIADHVKKVSKGNDRKKVKRMTLFFKIDCMERLFLMYASELLMRDDIAGGGGSGSGSRSG